MPSPKKDLVNLEGRDVRANGYLWRNEGKEQESRRIPEDFTRKKIIYVTDRGESESTTKMRAREQ